MFSKSYFYWILAVFVFISCNKESAINKQSDSDFIDFISSETPINSIIKIDSLIEIGNHSIYKKGLLYYEKGRNFGILEKDIEAIGSLEKALSFFVKEKNQEFIAKTSLLLGDSNAFLSRNEKALDKINEALVIFKKRNDKKNITKALNSLSHVFFQNNDFDKAIMFIEQAIEIQLESKDFKSLSASYNNIGYILEKKNDYKKAKYYYEEAIKLNDKTDRLNSYALQNLGAIHLIEGNLNKCRSVYLKALKIETKTSKLIAQKDIYEVLLDLSIKMKDFKKSSFYITKRDSINTILVKYENKEKIKLVKNQYKLIAKETELKQEKNLNNKNKVLFIVVMAFIAILGLFLYQKNKNSKLKLKQDKLILEQKVLRSQMNPHFIFNALTSIQKNLLEEDLLKSSTSLSRFAKLIRQNFEFTSKELVSLDEDLNALKNYIETQQLRFEDKFDYQINVQKGLDISYIKIPPMLLQPFVENAIEHGLKSKKEKGSLIINVLEKNDLTYFEIIDDGVGYKKINKVNDREHATDIFFNRLKLRNLNEEKSFLMTSLENGKGTKVEFSLKL